MQVREGGRELSVIFAPSVSAPGYRLVENSEYATIVDDYRASFEKLATLKPDVFLATHGSFFDLERKAVERRRKTASNPFIAPDEYRDFVARWRAQFEKELGRQKAK
jgi:metallo-beta-lactamase class B